MAYFKFQSIDPDTGNEIWVDSSTGETQLRPNTRPYSSTQAIPANTGPTTTLGSTDLTKIPIIDKATGINLNEDAPRAIQSPGVGAPNDDNSSGPNTQSGTNSILNARFNAPVQSQPNVLDQYASYTYNIGWYLITPDQFSALSNGPPNVNSWVLIAQSGGAEAQTDPNGNGKRSPFFAVDYYLDNLVIENSIAATPNSTMCVGANSLSFQVTEPAGLTLPGALAGAVQDYYKKAIGAGNFLPAEAFFVTVIKFYGYDIQGNLVTAGQNGATVQKIYPWHIKSFNFKLNNGIVEYHIEGTPVPYNINLGSKRGVIPEQFECVGVTVKDILMGPSPRTQNATGSEGRDGKTTPQVQTNNTLPPSPTIAGTAQESNPDGWGSEDSIDATNPNFYGEG